MLMVCLFLLSTINNLQFYLVLNKQTEEFQDLFLTTFNDKSNIVLYSIENVFQVKIY